MMVRRRQDILCLQEIRWTGNGVRELGLGCKLYYIGGKAKRNGVGIVVRGELSKTVVEVIRVDDRLMAVRVQVKGCMLFVVSAYAPQAGCTDGEKEHSREDYRNK